jgi:hypothetical protein
VGFRPISSRPRSKDGGVIFERQALLEASLVSVPSNPNCVAIASSLGISDETRALVFAERGANARAALARPQPPSALAVAEARVTKLTRERDALMSRLLRNVDALADAQEMAAVRAGVGDCQGLCEALKQIRIRETVAKAVSSLLGLVDRELWEAERHADRHKKARDSVAQMVKKGQRR